jgi:hypothetical protein
LFCNAAGAAEKREQILEIVFLRARRQAFLIRRAQLSQMDGESLEVLALEAGRVPVPTAKITKNTEKESPSFQSAGEKRLHFRSDSLALRDDGYRSWSLKWRLTRFQFLQSHL